MRTYFVLQICDVAKARSLQSCPDNYQDSTVFISPACVSRG